MKIEILFLLLPTEVGGRKNGIMAGYRCDWKIYKEKGSFTENILNCAAFELEEQFGSFAGFIEPGQTSIAILHPLKEEFWKHLKEGDIIQAYEGPKLIGQGKVWKVF